MQLVEVRAEQDNTLTAAQRWLQRLALEQPPPAQALAQIADLRRQIEPTLPEVFWRREGVDGRWAYDLLLHCGDVGTFSLAYTPKDAGPAVLREVRSMRDNAVVRVNQESLDVEATLAMLDFVWTDSRLLQRLVDECLVLAEIRRRALCPSKEALQAALDEFRRRRGLLTVEATEAFLAARGMTAAQLEAHVETECVTHDLKRIIAAERERAYFEAHLASFEACHLLVARFAEEAEMRACCAEYAQLAPEAAVDGLGRAYREGQAQALTSRRLGRHEAGDLADTLFEQRQSVAGRAVAGGLFELLVVVRRELPVFDAAAATICRNALFAAWLADQRNKADIEWFWGPESARAG